MQIIIVLAIVAAIIYFVRKSYNASTSKPDIGLMEDAPGRKILLVIGILTLIFVPIGQIGSYWLRNVGFMMWMPVQIETTVTIVNAVFRFIILGVLGIALRKNVQYAMVLFMLGWLTIIATIVTVLWNTVQVLEFFGLEFGLATFIGLLIDLGAGLLFPILFTVGASKNHDAYVAALEAAYEDEKHTNSNFQTEQKRPALTNDEWMVCSHCGVHNTEGGKFCSSCGTQLGATQPKTEAMIASFCNQCGWKNENKLKFCGECGKKLV